MQKFFEKVSKASYDGFDEFYRFEKFATNELDVLLDLLFLRLVFSKDERWRNNSVFLIEEHKRIWYNCWFMFFRKSQDAIYQFCWGS